MAARVFATGPEVSKLDEPTADPDRIRANRPKPRRGLTITLLISLGLHVAALIAVLLFLRPAVPLTESPEPLASVELVIEEHKGDVQSATPRQTPADAHETQPKTETKPETPAAMKPAMAPDPAPELDAPSQDAGPAAKTTPAAAPAREPDTKEPAATAQSEPPAAQPPITVTLSGTDSPSDARAWGDHVIPASPDAVFHNRPPEYPAEAVMNGEHGTVVLMIHVSPAGSTAGVDVVRSSGYVLLDRAAQEAVIHWRFLPAVKDGQAIASDMTMGFIFDFK
jgi:protein TonB